VLFSQKKTWKNIKYWEWIFIIESLIEILITVGFQIYLIVMALTGSQTSYINPIVVILGNCKISNMLRVFISHKNSSFLMQLMIFIIFKVLQLFSFSMES